MRADFSSIGPLVGGLLAHDEGDDRDDEHNHRHHRAIFI